MNITKSFIAALASLLLTSCHSSHITVGNMTHDHPVKTVAVKKNHFLLGGLVPLSRKQDAKEFIGNAKHYKIRTSHKFVDVLLTAITGSIYSPMTVTYYMSEFDTNEKYQQQRKTFDNEVDFEDNFSSGDFSFEENFEDVSPAIQEPIKMSVPPTRNATPPKTEPKRTPPTQSITPTQQRQEVFGQDPDLELIRRKIQQDRIEQQKQMKELEDLQKQINNIK